MTENIDNQNPQVASTNPNVVPAVPNPAVPVQPLPAQPNPGVIPQPTATVVPPVQPTPEYYPQSAPAVPPVQTPEVDPMAAVSNLNKEEAMEEALSHTTQYSPFQVEQQVVNQAPKKTDNKKAYIFIGVIAAIMAIFILLLPYISKLFHM